jgi:hypothetical protein
VERRAQENAERRLIERIKRHKTISVVGLAKNIGKTTVVNFLLRRLEKACVITVGVDGEKEDKIFKNIKPPVLLPKGNFAVIPSQMVPNGVKILETIDTPSANLSFVEALMDVEIKTMKIGSYDETFEVMKRMEKYANTIIVDGALARIGSISISDAVILVTGAQSGKNVEDIVSKTLQLAKRILTPQPPSALVESIKKMPNKPFVVKNGRISKIKASGVVGYEDEIEKAAKDAEYVYLPGAVTNEIASRIKCPIIVPSGDRIFSNVGKFFAVKKSELLGIAVNHTSIQGNEVEPDELISELKRRLNDGIIVFDVLYDHER